MVSRLPPATLERPVQTRFRYGSGAEHLSLATDEQLVGSLCKRHAVTRRPSEESRSAPTVCKHTVSGLFHSLLKGAFHLSLTVLVHYRSRMSI